MRYTYLTGRCANGAERDAGRLIHAVPDGTWTALGGIEPGRRSAGWSMNRDCENFTAPTCPRCRRKEDDHAQRNS
jgi:hypothetical protein